MSDGRILYTRWEYTDIAHAFTGRLMTMNPDGTCSGPLRKQQLLAESHLLRAVHP